ncbi:MAG: tryptophan-rich sensory protein [Clostridia bacterium]|nr:tryptophan-rich sensory protein [Clostridia bacterium]
MTEQTKKKITVYAISIAIPLAVGGLSAYLTKDNMQIYSTVETPPLSPPSILFPIAWTILYILMGISAATVLIDREKDPVSADRGLSRYALSLAFNFVWSILFFNFQNFLFSFVWLLVLLALIIGTILSYHSVSKKAAYLQIPYALWVAFAGYLNFGILYLNP